MIGKITVLIVDDQDFVRESIRAALEQTPDVEVVGEAADGNEALHQVESLSPDVALVDLRMPKADGLGAIAAIAAAHSRTRPVALSIIDARQCVREVFNVGAAGYVVKGESETRLADIIRSVAHGEVYVDPLVRKYLVSQLALAGSERLSDDESRLLMLVASGSTDAEIATKLGIDESEAGGRVDDMLQKLEFEEPVQTLAAKLRRSFL